jgi:hypothetical protein
VQNETFPHHCRRGRAKTSEEITEGCGVHQKAVSKTSGQPESRELSGICKDMLSEINQTQTTRGHGCVCKARRTGDRELVVTAHGVSIWEDRKFYKG